MGLTELLTLFGYTSDWLQLGVIDPAGLRRQLAEYECSDDKNPEHYRYRAFLSYLEKHDQIPDALLDKLLSLTDVGSDRVDLRTNRAFELLRSGLLTDLQIDYLRRRPEVATHKSFQKAARREQLMRRIAHTGVSEELFSQLQEFNDGILIRHTLEHEKLNRNQLEWVAEKGANRAVRNMAAQTLRRRDYQ